MMFAMMFFYGWGEGMKVSSINNTTVAFTRHLLPLQDAAWEAAENSGSHYFRNQLKK